MPKYGQPAQAIAESRGVLAHEPENLTAAANLVRFLAWTGERDAADAVWQTLRTRDPLNLPDDSLKLAEAAATLDDDAGESPHWHYHPPQSVAGRLRLHGLLVETTVGGTVHLAVPTELRAPLPALLG